jgi:uncharacterized FlgJ-related protein
MLYKFNRETLTFDKVGSPLKKMVSVAAVTAVISLGVGMLTASKVVYTPEQILNVNVNDEPFSEQALIEFIDKLNLKYPHIALAQAKIESADYTSGLFKKNNNLFGMREAKVRVNLAQGTRNKHAYYEHWQESVIDYALWCATYASKCKTEEQFLNLLAGYAEASHYKQAINNVVEKQKLRDKF